MDNTAVSVESSIQVVRPDQSCVEIPATRHLMVQGNGMFPALVRLQSGTLLGVVRGGAEHMGKGGRLDVVRSVDEGVSWSAPETILDSDEDDRNPVLCQLADGTLVLAYSRCWTVGYGVDAKHPEPIDKHETFATRSTDEGRTWEEPQRVPVPPGFAATGSPGGGHKGIQLADGTALFTGGVRRTLEVPLYGYPGIFRSTDGGRSWGDFSEFDLGLCDEEVALLELPSGRLLAALRGGGAQLGGAALWLSESDDGGHTWSQPARKITGEDQHPADLLLLSDGSVLLSFGNRNPPFGVRALVSRDQGQSWDHHHSIVLADNCAGRDCGYPTTLHLAAGYLLTVYYRTRSAAPYFAGLGETIVAACVKYKEADLLAALDA